MTVQDVRTKCLNYLKVGTPAAWTEIYLRLLYSPNWMNVLEDVINTNKNKIDEKTLSLFKRFDHSLLHAEQEHRKRNLRVHILRACPSLQIIFSQTKLDCIIRSYENSESFWIPRGRTLSENFCLFSYESNDLGIKPFQKDMIRLCGIISGLSELPNKNSPWTKEKIHSVKTQNVIAMESFHSNWRLIDKYGNLPNEKNYMEFFKKYSNKIVIYALKNGLVSAISLRL